MLVWFPIHYLNPWQPDSFCDTCSRARMTGSNGLTTPSSHKIPMRRPRSPCFPEASLWFNHWFSACQDIGRMVRSTSQDQKDITASMNGLISPIVLPIGLSEGMMASEPIVGPPLPMGERRPDVGRRPRIPQFGGRDPDRTGKVTAKTQR